MDDNAECVAIFLPRAARLVNTRNLNMSVLRQNVPARNKALPSQLLYLTCYTSWLFFPP